MPSKPADAVCSKAPRNFVDDVRHNGGRPRQVDTSPFVFGENIAATPGKVVYRNDLIELIQYEPQTPQVHAAPLLCSPPWINKYYVMDLAPKRSFIEWAVQHNRTVFAISYRNPTAEMSGVTMDDYLRQRARKQALDVITDITGADTIDIVGLCLGGALTAITAAYLVRLRRRAGRQPDAAQHDARLLRSRRARTRSPTPKRWNAWSRRWPRPAISTATRWREPSTCCGPTT